MDNMRAKIRKCRACLMRHRMHDAKQRIGKCHSRKTLGVVHGISLCHIAVVRIYKITLNHFDCMQRKRIRKITVCRRNISLYRVRHRIHARMGHQLLGHRLCKIRIYDSDIRGNFKICNRIFNAFSIIGNNGKRRYFRRRAGCGRNRTEMRFFS